MVSVLILTLNEEENLPRCLKSLDWCDDVVVLDSYSDDQTVEIAKAFGAKVVQREFDDYASQRNFGLNEISYKYPWVFMIDADEEVPLILTQEVERVTGDDSSQICLYRVRRKDYFLGKWIKRSSGYPTWAGRLIKIGHVKVEREINEEYNTPGKVGFLENHLNHYSFNKGFSAWLEKHNRYSTMEAKLMVNGGLCRISMSDLMSNDPALRRRGIKAVVYRLPFRPLWVFFILYVLRGGFLDGRAGFVFCVLRSFYEFMINCKIKELHIRQQGLPL